MSNYYRQGTTTYWLIVTIAGKDFVHNRKWTGSSVKAIHRAAKEKYAREFPGATILFGSAFSVNSYGAH